jgi:hypothetical protein
MSETLLITAAGAGLAGLLALALRRLLAPPRRSGPVQVDFDGYKDREIHRRGHYQQIVK